MDYQGIFTFILVLIIAIGIIALRRWLFNVRRKQRKDFYKNYLQSGDWKRKRYLVLKRDNWRCVYCGAPATEVHHLKYAKRRIGKEPINLLVSICKDCHNSKHQ